MGDDCVVFVVPVNERVTNEKITKHFSGSGRVVRIDRYNNGTCFVSFSAPEEAQHAIQTLHRTVFSGRIIKVEAKKVKGERSLHFESDWTLYCESVHICSAYNIYDCQNAIPGGTCLKGRHCCFYCVACENGFQPHKNVDVNCPSRKAGFKDLERFKSKRHRQLSEQRVDRGSVEGSRSLVTVSQQTPIQNTIQRVDGGSSTGSRSQPLSATTGSRFQSPSEAIVNRSQASSAAPGRQPQATLMAPGRQPQASPAAPGRQPQATLMAPGRQPQASPAAPGRQPQATPMATGSQPQAARAATCSRLQDPLAAMAMESGNVTSNRSRAESGFQQRDRLNYFPTTTQPSNLDIRHQPLANQNVSLQPVAGGSLADDASLARNHLPSQSNENRSISGGAVRFKNMKMEGGKWHDVFISSYDEGPTDFAIQLASSTKQLDSLMEDIGRPDRLVLVDRNKITGGKCCLAASMSDNKIYRAIVLKCSNNMALVCLVDYGIVEKLEFNRIFHISDIQIQPPIFSVRCHLSRWPDLPPPSKALAKKRFEVYKNRSLKCKIVPSTESKSSDYFATKEVQLIDDQGFVVWDEIKRWISDKSGEAGDGHQLSLQPKRSAQKSSHVLLKETIKNKNNNGGRTPRENIRKGQSNIPAIVVPQKCSFSFDGAGGKSGDGASGGVKGICFPAKQYNKFSPRSKKNPYIYCAPETKRFRPDESGLCEQQGWSATASNSFAGNLGSSGQLARKSLEFTVPQVKIGVILGPLNSRINKIRMESGAQISIVVNPENSDEAFVTIEGSTMAVQAAQSMLIAALKNNS